MTSVVQYKETFQECLFVNISYLGVGVGTGVSDQ